MVADAQAELEQGAVEVYSMQDDNPFLSLSAAEVG